MEDISLERCRLWEEIPDQWKFLFDKDEIIDIDGKIGNKFQPALNQIFRALEIAPNKVEVLIVGQDPYPNHLYSMGLAFSVNKEATKIPASLRNIYKELESDLGIKRVNGDLSDWTTQGVMLLNQSLTIDINSSGSHRRIGWHNITGRIVDYVAKQGAIGVLWGQDAAKFNSLFPKEKLIETAHPSPLSAHRGFFGSKPFSRVNEILRKQGKKAINW
ncbi:MAG: uracil-DNA glycosylase [Actinobacteria bacterium]|nr:uracil-DNA glycosylase [Actinomycetota bacterium]